MSKWIYGLAGLLLSTGVAVAQTQPNTWQGSMTITQLPGAACASADGLQLGQLWTAVYRPRIGASGPSRLQFVGNRGAVNYEKSVATGQMNGAGAYSATRLGGRASVQTFTGNFNLVTVPANVVANTPIVTMTGTITNFEGNTGCTGRISASFSKRPD